MLSASSVYARDLADGCKRDACAGGFKPVRGRSLKQGGFNFGNTGSLLSGINFGSLGLNFQSLDSQVHHLLPVHDLRACLCGVEGALLPICTWDVSIGS